MPLIKLFNFRMDRHIGIKHKQLQQRIQGVVIGEKPYLSRPNTRLFGECVKEKEAAMVEVSELSGHSFDDNDTDVKVTEKGEIR